MSSNAWQSRCFWHGASFDCARLLHGRACPRDSEGPGICTQFVAKLANFETDCRGINKMETYDWDQFWDFAARSRLFLRILYFVHFKQYKRLVKETQLSAPRILELGAGTGVIPQRLLMMLGGSAVLVDNNLTAHSLFTQFRVKGLNVEYRIEDMFSLDFHEEFDLVCSDGLLEHFEDKERVLAIHVKAAKPNGFIILFVPHDTAPMRFLNKRGPNCGREELFSMKELVSLCEANGLTVAKRVSYFFEIGVLCRKA